MRRLAVREKQAYGAILLKHFCAINNVNNVQLDILVEELFSILISSNLPDWEQRCQKLDFSGREDSFEHLNLSIDVNSEIRNSLFQLIRLVIEIGLANMYSNVTSEPRALLKKSIRILKKHQIELPDNMFLNKGKS